MPVEDPHRNSKSFIFQVSLIGGHVTKTCMIEIPPILPRHFHPALLVSFSPMLILGVVSPLPQTSGRRAADHIEQVEQKIRSFDWSPQITSRDGELWYLIPRMRIEFGSRCNIERSFTSMTRLPFSDSSVIIRC